MKSFKAFINENESAIDIQKAEAIQALSKLSEISQDQEFRDSINNMIDFIKRHNGMDSTSVAYGNYSAPQGVSASIDPSLTGFGSQIRN